MCWRRRGGGATGYLFTKQAVEFPQVLASNYEHRPNQPIIQTSCSFLFELWDLKDVEMASYIIAWDKCMNVDFKS